MDADKFQKLSQTKCNLCFRKDCEDDNCMLYSSKHDGIENCLGPFKDQDGRLQKIVDRKRRDFLDRAIRDVVLKNYLRKKWLFEDWENDKGER